jgi:hypothetical protein
MAQLKQKRMHGLIIILQISLRLMSIAKVKSQLDRVVFDNSEVNR